jgi:hypothetical protein
MTHNLVCNLMTGSNYIYVKRGRIPINILSDLWCLEYSTLALKRSVVRITCHVDPRKESAVGGLFR